MKQLETENNWYVLFYNKQEKEDQEDGSIHFEAEVAGIFEIKTWIMSWGAKAKIIEPESLKNEVLSEIKSLNNLYNWSYLYLIEQVIKAAINAGIKKLSATVLLKLS